MDNLEKNTKSELIKIVKNLNSTIDARDKEITDLKVKNDRHSEFITQKNKEISSVREELNKVRLEKLKADPTEVAEIKKELDAYKKALEGRTKSLQSYITQYGNLLKIMSGTLGQALDLNEFMEKEVK